MNYEKIFELVKREIEDVEMIEVEKTNTVLHGIRRKPEADKILSVRPVVYLENFHDLGEEEAAFAIAHMLRTAPIPTIPFDDIENHRFDMLRVRLVNQKWNNLENRPWIPLADLGITLYLSVDEDKTIQVTNDIAKRLFPEYDLSDKKDLTSLFTLATVNTKRSSEARVVELSKMMAELGAPSEGMFNSGMLYVLTGTNPWWGAVAILYAKDELKELGKKLGKEKLTLLPSSTHEWLIVATDDHVSKEEYSWLICDINEEEVAVEERLSNHPYIYDTNTGLITSEEDED